MSTEKLLSRGTLATAMCAAHGHYLAGIFSDDLDGKGRFYVNLQDKLPSADAAIARAKAAQSGENYRQWDEGYECQIFRREGQPLPTKPTAESEPPSAVLAASRS